MAGADGVAVMTGAGEGAGYGGGWGWRERGMGRWREGTPMAQGMPGSDGGRRVNQLRCRQQGELAVVLPPPPSTSLPRWTTEASDCRRHRPIALRSSACMNSASLFLNDKRVPHISVVLSSPRSARYRALPAAERAKHTVVAHAAAEVEREERRAARAGRTGSRALESWNDALDGMGIEEARALLASIDAAMLATEERRKALLDKAAVLPPTAGQDELLVVDDVEDMDAWINELMWDGVEPLVVKAAAETAAQPGYSSGVQVQHVTTGVCGQQQQMQVLSTGSDHYGYGQFTGGSQPQYQYHQQRDAMAMPLFGQRGGFPCSINVNHGFHQSIGAHGGSASFDISARNNAIAASVVGYPYPDGCSFTGAPPGVIGMGRTNPINAMCYQRQGVAANYPYRNDMAAGFQMKARSNNNAIAHNVLPINRFEPTTYYGQVGYPSMNVRVVSAPSYNTPAAPAESSVVTTARAISESVAASGLDYDYETSCLLAAGVEFQCPDDLHNLGLEQLNYFSDVADGLVVF
ncbi:hypothetical protein QOZ80_5BG0435310 [Eleusine coracana subsp. coracana]|nr:hypothetical protein QOZ80_5BG0435310 [Eleusine coracana subsp. coracana]